MKFTKNILTVLAVLFLCTSAFAQRGFDTFSVARWLVVAPPTLFSGATALNLGTNNWVDIRSLSGIATINLFCRTNTGDSALTITVQTSNDQTNLSTLANVALAIPATVNYTNRYYGGTNVIAANVFNLYGSVVTPTASTSGFATPYINPAAVPYTNTISATTPSYNTFSTYSVNIADAPSYIRLIVIPSGATTNFDIGAILTSVPDYSSYPF